MLQAIEDLLPYEKQFPGYSLMDSSLIRDLQAQIKEWRALRQHKYGNSFSIQNAICIAFSLFIFAR